MADLAVLETLLGVASPSGPLRFRAEAERYTLHRPPRPEAPWVAELADQSPEGTEERQAPCDEGVNCSFPEGPALRSPGP